MNDQKITRILAADGSTATIILSGELNIEAAAELQRTLNEAFSESPLVSLDARQLEEVDVTIHTDDLLCLQKRGGRQAAFCAGGRASNVHEGACRWHRCPYGVALP